MVVVVVVVVAVAVAGLGDPREEDGRSRGLGECTSLGAPS